MEQDYEKYKRLILKRSLYFHNHFPFIETEDFFSIGSFSFVESSRKYLEQKGNFTSYFLIRLNGAMLDEVRRQAVHSRKKVKYQKHIEEVREGDKEGFLENSVQETLEGLSEDGWQVINLVLSPPKTIQEKVLQRRGTKCLNRIILKKFLVKEKSWTDYKVNQVFKEIESKLWKENL